MEWHWLSALGGALPTGAIVTAWFKWQEGRRRREAGCRLFVTGGVDHRSVRLARLSIRNWSDSPMKLRTVRVLWPLSARALNFPTADAARAWQGYPKSHATPDAVRTISHEAPEAIPVGKSSEFPIFVPVPKSLAGRRSRSRIYVLATCELLDAMNRTQWLPLRSPPVDWERPPQD
jgi:hypothetical protein